MLTKADDFPVHQLPEPIATSGTDRNFYDRYFFNGYTLDGHLFFALALGIYPHLNVMDAAFSMIEGGVQHNLRASRLLNSERLDTRVGPISVSVIEPLERLKIEVADNSHGIRAELVFSARAKRSHAMGKVIDEDEREPQPIARAALRWLKRNPPPPAQKICVVHGDYRTGNFLFDAEGDIRAVLDWEMAHLGDPLEDLAWWEIFASLKGLAIWISAAREYAEGRNVDPVNAFSGWFCLAFHNNVLAERLGK